MKYSFIVWTLCVYASYQRQKHFRNSSQIFWIYGRTFSRCLHIYINQQQHTSISKFSQNENIWIGRTEVSTMIRIMWYASRYIHFIMRIESIFSIKTNVFVIHAFTETLRTTIYKNIFHISSKKAFLQHFPYFLFQFKCDRGDININYVLNDIENCVMWYTKGFSRNIWFHIVHRYFICRHWVFVRKISKEKRTGNTNV